MQNWNNVDWQCRLDIIQLIINSHLATNRLVEFWLTTTNSTELQLATPKFLGLHFTGTQLADCILESLKIAAEHYFVVTSANTNRYSITIPYNWELKDWMSTILQIWVFFYVISLQVLTRGKKTKEHWKNTRRVHEDSWSIPGLFRTGGILRSLSNIYDEVLWETANAYNYFQKLSLFSQYQFFMSSSSWNKCDFLLHV